MDDVKFALLAPVPWDHFDAARHMDQKKIAFGSNNIAVFEKLRELLKGKTTDVFIYAPTSGQPSAMIAWRAKLIGIRESKEKNGGPYPGDKAYRPKTTEGDTSWKVYWEVEPPIEKLSEPIPIHHFSGYRNGKPYKPKFIPRGPLIVDRL